MSNSKTVLLVLAALVLPLSLAFAGGAGGVTWSDQHYISGLSSSTLATSEVGGFGYRVSRGGMRTGGFGYAIYSQPGADSLAGGVGGVILGQEGRSGPFTVAANIWTGIGAVSATFSGTHADHVVLFGEANVELGIAVTPWMQLSAYAGMQGIAGVDPRTGIGGELVRYSPVAGMRLSWGSFESARW
jgi:hypothetical protein